MITAIINGYTLEIAEVNMRGGVNFIFVTLFDEEKNRHHFNMIKPNGEWMIRNPKTVPSFILKIEKDISKSIS
jgi:hypothetical protein